VEANLAHATPLVEDAAALGDLRLSLRDLRALYGGYLPARLELGGGRRVREVIAMVSAWRRGRPMRVARLVLWVAVVMLLAGGALAYSCAPAASAARSAPNLPPGQTMTAIAGE
jgi:hypothetical protein